MCIANLPKYIIQKIIDDIRFAGDVICLFLAVKSLYLERNGYTLFMKDGYNSVRFHMNSFKSFINPSYLHVSSYDIDDVIKSCVSLNSLSTLHYDTNLLKLCHLPSNITNLALLRCFINIKESDIPNTVQTLYLQGALPQPGIIPKTVKSLRIYPYVMEDGWDLPPNVIPDSVEYLDYECGSSLTSNSLPRESIKTLKLGDGFKQRLLHGSVPPSVTSLSLGPSYREAIEPGVLPNSIQHLKMGMFNQPITDATFPTNLRTLSFWRFSQDISSLAKIVSLEELHLGNNFYSRITAFPPMLTSLTLPGPYNRPASELMPLLPLTLRKLTLGGWNQPLTESGILPSSLTYLGLSDSFDSEIGTGCLPMNLKVLLLSKKFNQPLVVGVLPDGLERLEFGEAFNQPIQVGVLPKSLNNLKFGALFNQNIIPSSLPEGLECLVFGNSFNQPLQVGSLSSTKLRTLHFGMSFEQTLTTEQLPTTLEDIHFELTLKIDKSKTKSLFKFKTKTKPRTQIIGFLDVDDKDKKNQQQEPKRKTTIFQPKVIMHSPDHFRGLGMGLKNREYELSSAFYYLLDNSIGFEIVIMGILSFDIKPCQSHVLVLDKHLEGGFIKTSKLRDFSFAFKRKLFFGNYSIL